MTGAPSASGPVAAAERLTAALEATAAALSVPTLDALLASEAALQHALATLPRPGVLAAGDRVLLRQEIETARTALARCRRLGGTLDDFIRYTLHAHGEALGYERSRPVAAGRALDMRA
jgi:hypothetical protein